MKFISCTKNKQCEQARINQLHCSGGACSAAFSPSQWRNHLSHTIKGETNAFIASHSRDIVLCCLPWKESINVSLIKHNKRVTDVWLGYFKAVCLNNFSRWRLKRILTYLLAKFDLVNKLLIENPGTRFGKNVFVDHQKFSVFSHHDWGCSFDVS